MKYFNLFLIHLFMFSCNACRENKPENEEVEIIEIANCTPTDVLLSEFTTDMEVVKLETADDLLLGVITHVKITDRFIYVKDIHFDGIYEFDRKGIFVKKLHKKGQGHGEYVEISDFIIDEAQNTLEIFDKQTKKLMVYTLSDFSFIKDISVPLSVAFGFVKKGDIYYFNSKRLRNTVNGQPTNSEIIAYNPSDGKLSPLFDRILPDDEYGSWEFSNGFAINSQNDIFFSIAWQNQCFKVENTSIKPVLWVDVGTHAVPNRIRNGTYDQQIKYLKSSLGNDKFLFIRLLMYEGGNFMVSCEKGYSPSNCYYYIRSGGQDYFTDRIRNDFIPAHPDLDMNYVAMERGYLIYVLIPDVTSSSQIKPQLEYFNVGSEDNPILLLFKIKT